MEVEKEEAEGDGAIELLTVAELLRRGRALTASSSLNSSPSKPTRKQNPESQLPPSPPLATPSQKVLTPYGRPAILIGTLTLPPDTLACPNRTCFQFSDDSSASLCCDILGFTPRLLGMRISVLAWNFIPFKHSACGGFLEIIKWNSSALSTLLPHCSGVDSYPLVPGSCYDANPEKLKARYRVHGPIASVSPVSVVPCSVGDSKTDSLRGFVARVLACECELCNSKISSVLVLHNLPQKQDKCHLFTKAMFVYFCGTSWRWHSAITKLVGHVVTIAGLKKKLVFIGKKDSQLMFVTTELSTLHLPDLCKPIFPPPRGNVTDGKGECGVYTGVVKGVYMHGMILELEKEVWLLITDPQLSVPHSLRVGAIVCAWNVHFVNPKFSWTKMLILGACFKTSITVQSYSPLENGYHLASESQSQLGNFIASLAFSARLWTLLVISCFRKKFSGILSEKEILGSKHKEGLAQLFSRSYLSPSVFRVRHGVLAEICKNDSCGCGSGEPCCGNLKLVLPISTFLAHCETTWIRMLLRKKRSCQTLHASSQFTTLTCSRTSHGQPLRWTFTSEDMGVILLGSLKMSPYSGRLQLVDATGSIDAVIPDLPSTWATDSIYEVVNYTLIIEGMSQNVSHLGSLDTELLSCRRVFHYIPQASGLNLTIYIYFHLRNSICKNLRSYPCLTSNGEPSNGRYHLIWVAHKYPLLRKFHDEASKSDSVFVEAIVLPWDLFLNYEDVTIHPVDIPMDQLHEPWEHCDGKLFPNKKHKTNEVSIQELSSRLMDGCRSGRNEVCNSISFGEFSEDMYGNLSSDLEFPCMATFKKIDSHKSISSGKLCFKNCSATTGGDLKALLEFNSENLLHYQLLQIGHYYAIKHCGEECFCCKEYNNIRVHRVLITCELHLWSLSFSSSEVGRNNKSSPNSFQDGSFFSKKEVFTKNQTELHLQRSTDSSSDICLHLSAGVRCLLNVKFNEMKDGLRKPLSSTKQRDSSDMFAMSASSLSSGPSDSSGLFPEGNLISLTGNVVAMHGIEYNASSFHLDCASLRDDVHMRVLQAIANSFCIHVMADNQMVSIVGSVSKYTCPLGFGPGANATFHRVLKLRGTNRLMLTPVSFILINSIRVANGPHHDKSLRSAAYIPPPVSLDDVPYGMISEVVHCMDGKPMKFNCRVVAIHSLLLEKKRKYNDLHSQVPSGQHFVNIPLVGLTLDDGSSSCCCWANAERAATLLRLHEQLTPSVFDSSGATLKWVGKDNSSWKSTMYHLDRILEKHDRVTVKNYGSVVDFTFQNLTISVSSDDNLSFFDENILKSIIFNACSSTSLTVVACVMNPNVVNGVEKELLVEMETTDNPVPNLWAIEVCYTDTLREARNMVLQLPNR